MPVLVKNRDKATDLKVNNIRKYETNGPGSGNKTRETQNIAPLDPKNDLMRFDDNSIDSVNGRSTTSSPTKRSTCPRQGKLDVSGVKSYLFNASSKRSKPGVQKEIIPNGNVLASSLQSKRRPVPEVFVDVAPIIADSISLPGPQIRLQANADSHVNDFIEESSNADGNYWVQNDDMQILPTFVHSQTPPDSGPMSDGYCDIQTPHELIQHHQSNTMPTTHGVRYAEMLIQGILLERERQRQPRPIYTRMMSEFDPLFRDGILPAPVMNIQSQPTVMMKPTVTSPWHASAVFDDQDNADDSEFVHSSPQKSCQNDSSTDLSFSALEEARNLSTEILEDVNVNGHKSFNDLEGQRMTGLYYTRNDDLPPVPNFSHPVAVPNARMSLLMKPPGINAPVVSRGFTDTCGGLRLSSPRLKYWDDKNNSGHFNEISDTVSASVASGSAHKQIKLPPSNMPRSRENFRVASQEACTPISGQRSWLKTTNNDNDKTQNSRTIVLCSSPSSSDDIVDLPGDFTNNAHEAKSIGGSTLMSRADCDSNWRKSVSTATALDLPRVTTVTNRFVTLSVKNEDDGISVPVHSASSKPSRRSAPARVQGQTHLNGTSVSTERRTVLVTESKYDTSWDCNCEADISFEREFVGNNAETIFKLMTNTDSSSRVDQYKMKYKFIDSHCHLDFMFSKEKESIPNDPTRKWELYKAFHALTWSPYLKAIITNFCDPHDNFRKSDVKWAELRKCPDVFASFGCHPHHVEYWRDHRKKCFDILEKQMGDDKVKAIGEMGLDYSQNNNQNHDVQKEIFRAQLKLAIKYKKPIVIHCRDADEDCLEIMEEELDYNRSHPIHRHCFTRDLVTANKWRNAFKNLYFGFTPMIFGLSVKHYLAEVIKKLPLNRILVETDAPYFLPRELRDKGLKTSHPSVAFYVAHQIADFRNVGLDAVCDQIYQNTCTLYDLS